MTKEITEEQALVPLTLSGESLDSLDFLEDFIIEKNSLNHGLIHQYFLYQQKRIVTKASSKTRAEVRGGGAKPWKQKGTGRARAGSIRSPLWKGGGVIFGPKPKVIRKKMNKLQRRKALRSTISFTKDKIALIKELPRITKVKQILPDFKKYELLEKKVLFVLDLKREDQRGVDFKKSVGNIKNLKLIDWRYLNPVDLLLYDKVLLEKDILRKVRAWLMKN